MPSKLLLMVMSSVLSVLALTCNHQTKQLPSTKASADSMSLAMADTMKVSDRREEQMTACLPGAWIVHGGNGPLFVRESSLQGKSLEREEKTAPLRCW
ncbi:MAG: hypothetical protein ACREOO_19380 [bacterium]